MWATILPILGQVAMSMLGGGSDSSSGVGNIAGAASSLLGGQKKQGNDLVNMGQGATPAPQLTPFQPKSTSEILASLMNKNRGF